MNYGNKDPHFNHCIVLNTCSDMAIENSCVETYNTEMKKGFYLVNVGQFHNVWNKNEDRYCLSACLIDSRTSYRLNFNELQQRLKGYII